MKVFLLPANLNDWYYWGQSTEVRYLAVVPADRYYSATAPAAQCLSGVAAPSGSHWAVEALLSIDAQAHAAVNEELKNLNSVVLTQV